MFRSQNETVATTINNVANNNRTHLFSRLFLFSLFWIASSFALSPLLFRSFPCFARDNQFVLDANAITIELGERIDIYFHFGDWGACVLFFVVFGLMTAIFTFYLPSDESGRKLIQTQTVYLIYALWVISTLLLTQNLFSPFSQLFLFLLRYSIHGCR